MRDQFLTFLHRIIIPSLYFLIACGLLHSLFWKFLRIYRTVPIRYKSAILAGISYIIYSVCLYIIAASDPESAIVFFYWGIVNLPLVYLAAELFESYNMPQALAFFISFGIGSFAFAYLGLVIGRIIEKILKNKKRHNNKMKTK